MGAHECIPGYVSCDANPMHVNLAPDSYMEHAECQHANPEALPVRTEDSLWQAAMPYFACAKEPIPS